MFDITRAEFIAIREMMFDYAETNFDAMHDFLQLCQTKLGYNYRESLAFDYEKRASKEAFEKFLKFAEEFTLDFEDNKYYLVFILQNMKN